MTRWIGVYGPSSLFKGVPNFCSLKFLNVDIHVHRGLHRSVGRHRPGWISGFVTQHRPRDPKCDRSAIVEIITWDVDRLVDAHPVLYHMAAKGSWPSIQQRGLLSTSALLDLFEVEGRKRQRLESMRRPKSVVIEHSEHGSAVVRDQGPLSDGALKRCLVDMTPTEWYELLNSKTFFWPNCDRLSSLMNAQIYRSSVHTVLEVDTKSVIGQHEDRLLLSPINSGATIYVPPERGTFTFQPIHEFSGPTVAEVVFEHSVPDVVAHTMRVTERRGDEVLRVIWEP